MSRLHVYSHAVENTVHEFDEYKTYQWYVGIWNCVQNVFISVAGRNVGMCMSRMYCNIVSVCEDTLYMVYPMKFTRVCYTLF